MYERVREGRGNQAHAPLMRPPGRCLMPRTATVLAAREDEETTTHVDELIQRGRGQGFLSLPELRDAFDQARVSPTEARSIIRELTEAGVQLGNDAAPASGSGASPAASPQAGDQAADTDGPAEDA